MRRVTAHGPQWQSPPRPTPALAPHAQAAASPALEARLPGSLCGRISVQEGPKEHNPSPPPGTVTLSCDSGPPPHR